MARRKRDTRTVTLVDGPLAGRVLQAPIGEPTIALQRTLASGPGASVYAGPASGAASFVWVGDVDLEGRPVGGYEP